MNKHPIHLLALCMALLVCRPAFAQAIDETVRGALPSNDWLAVSDDMLDGLRGGFDVGQGLTVSFGIIRSVTINGDLVSQTSFNLPDVTRVTADQARLAATALSGSGIVQNGVGNAIDPAVASHLPSGALVVQNSLSDQNIQTLTVINAGVNSLGLLKSINSQATLKDALLAPLGVR